MSILLDKYDGIFGADGFLNKQNVERREEVEIIGLSSISGVDTLFLGDPGTGKTWLIELLVNYCLSDMSLFTHLFAKDQSADEVLGPRDVVAMKSGKIARLMDGYAPEANYCYWDEVFKASPPMLNPMLDLLANRVLKVGGNVVDCGQLITIMMSSNELPDREDLLAFRDRIGITKFVQPVRTSEGRRRVMDIQLDVQANGIDPNPPTLTLDDIHAIRAAISAVEVPDPIREVADKAQGMWADKGHPPSQRRMGQMWRIAKAEAWRHGRDHVTTDDLLPWQHMAWNHPDHYDSALNVILEFASVFTRKANRMKEALEPVLRELDSVRAKIDAAGGEPEEEHLEEGFKAMRSLRKLRREADGQITDGKGQGQDVSELEKLVGRITDAEQWIEAALTEG